METLLTPDFGLSLWTITIFLILVAILGRYAWKPLLKTLQDREDGIRRAVADAAEAKLTVESLKAQLEKELAASYARAQAMLAEAQADAAKVRDRLIKEAESEAQRLMEQTRRQLEEEKARLSRELRQEVVHLSVQVAEKLLHHAVDAHEQESLVQGFISEIDGARKN